MSRIRKVEGTVYQVNPNHCVSRYPCTLVFLCACILCRCALDIEKLLCLKFGVHLGSVSVDAGSNLGRFGIDQGLIRGRFQDDLGSIQDRDWVHPRFMPGLSPDYPMFYIRKVFLKRLQKHFKPGSLSAARLVMLSWMSAHIRQAMRVRGQPPNQSSMERFHGTQN